MDRIIFCIVLLVFWAVATGFYFYCQRVKVGDLPWENNDPNEQDIEIDNEASNNTNIQEETEERQSKKEERKERILQALQTKQIVSDEGDNTNSGGEDSGVDTILIADVHEACGEECNICLAPFNIGDYVSTQQRQHISLAGFRCQHTFHTTCIKQWLLNNNGCPICRSSYLNEVERVINSEANTVVELEGQQNVNNV